MQDIARDKLLEMGPNPDSWPRWPVLPVKKHTAPHYQLGYVREEYPDGRGFEELIHVRDGNCFMPENTDPVIATYSSWQEMADDGWVVD